VEGWTDLEYSAVAMLRTTVLAFAVVALLSKFALGGELCVMCVKPDAVYRCSVDQSTQFAKFKFGKEIQGRVCIRVLSKKGGHERCAIVQNSNAICDGSPRTITFTDYEQAMAGDGTSTYEPGLIAKVGDKITKTWICVTSLFKIC
jgi:hypothetical protein